ncbi:hypothetical protein LBMAG42_38570 [Deltaproteobacteria bacterium]|nr:hypothetical protein LBMAG42_38570 [Deltaproteobacteria bacterium]
MTPLPPSAQAILDRVFGRALVRAEVSIARTRLAVVGIALTEEFIWLGMRPEARSQLLAWVPVLALVVGGMLTVHSLRRLRTQAPRAGSAALDAGLILGVALPAALAPDADYTGAFHHPPSMFFLVAIAAAGHRMSRTLVRVSAAANVACILLLLAVDAKMGSPAGRLDEWILWIMAFIAVSMIADGFALRARRLATYAAQSVLTAERTRQALGVYVSEEVAEEALSQRGLTPGGHRQAVAVLYADLRGYTAYANQLPPERLVAELNAYLDALVPVIREHGGVVDKFVGDAVMVVFGMPRTMPDAASRALRAAVAMQRALARHNEERATLQCPPLKLSIGVHFGEVVLGNIGCAERMQYTVVGDAVNLATRLQGVAKERGLALAVSGAVVDIAGRQDGVPAPTLLGPVTIAGRTDATLVYVLTDADVG